MPTPWTDPALPRFASATNEHCDNAVHGWDCQCLDGVFDGQVIDEELAKMEADLDEAEDEESMAEAAVEEAEEQLERWRDRVTSLQRAIGVHRTRRAAEGAPVWREVQA